MKFESLSRKQRSRRSNSSLRAPAVVESLEVRSLMTVIALTGPVDGPPPTINDATPTMTWDAVDSATSYELWVNDGEQRTVQFIESNITATNFTPTTELNLGRTRAWVRANFANGTSSEWSLPTDFVVHVVPTVTGPVNSLLSDSPHKLAETKPAITWTSPPGAFRFEVIISNQTTLTSRTIRVANQTPLLDGDGNTQPDGNGDVLRQEVRTYQLENDLLMGNYRVFVRSLDDGGRTSAWSSAFDFEVAPPVTITRPMGASFQNPPLLEWQAVPGATDYDVWFAKASTPNTPLYNLKFRTGTSYQIPAKLTAGDYVFWVRAHRRVSGRPETVGIWSRTGYYSTIKNPVVTGPVGIESNIPDKRVVTEARPTIEWQPIDKAARYDVWVERTNGKPPYFNLQTTSSTNSYRFEQDLEPGKYLVWVRAVSTTGVLTGWSTPYGFEATGGIPIITSPAANASVSAIPDITWTSVPDADSYDIWIAKVGETYDYIRTSGITLTTYAPTDPLPTGTYRVWVRAVSNEGTTHGWSAPVTFTVTSNNVEQPSGEFPELLAALLQTTGNAQQTDTVAEVAARKSSSPEIADAPVDAGDIPLATMAMFPAPATIPAGTSATEGFIQQLAEQCTTAEWWMPHGTES